MGTPVQARMEFAWRVEPIARGLYGLVRDQVESKETSGTRQRFSLRWTASLEVVFGYHDDHLEGIGLLVPGRRKVYCTAEEWCDSPRREVVKVQW